MPKAAINDISMYYEIHGEGEPLVLIVGFGADHSHWTRLIHKFKSHYQVIILDNRGSGQTDVPEGPYSIEQMAADVATLCEYLNIKQAHFLGNSMGGYIVQMLAYRYPALVKSIVISNSCTTTHAPFMFYAEAQLELFQAGAPLAAILKASCSWVYSYQFLSQEKMLDNLLEYMLACPYPFTLVGYQGQLAALNNFDSRKWVNQIQAPTLVIGADQDIIFLEAWIKELAELIPHARYYSFKECGHLPFIEYPEKFAEVIKKFIGTI